ncbi:MAG: DUF1232 domain-containing protein [Cyanobacterium sp. T60_A2020_053]|nr:DUF1232 domain-containing protein [Cyanobacterium sp. T60_A2020_053]
MNFNPLNLYGWYRNTIRNPRYRLWIILGTFAYLLSPLDISPDIFPIVGQIDDFVVVSIMLSEISQLILSGSKKQKSSPSNNDNSSDKTVDVEAVSMD